MAGESKHQEQLRDLREKPVGRKQAEATKGGFLGGLIKKAAPVVKRVARVS